MPAIAPARAGMTWLLATTTGKNCVNTQAFFELFFR